MKYSKLTDLQLGLIIKYDPSGAARSMATELLLLRAECKAARLMRDSELNFGRAQPSSHAGDANRLRVDAGKDYDVVRSASDEAGFAP